MKIDQVCFTQHERLPRSGVSLQVHEVKASDGWDIEFDLTTACVSVRAQGEDVTRTFLPGAVRWVQFTAKQAKAK